MREREKVMDRRLRSSLDATTVQTTILSVVSDAKHLTKDLCEQATGY